MDKNEQIADKISFEKTGRKLIQQIKEAERIDPSALHSSWIKIRDEVYSPSVSKKRNIHLIAAVAASVAILLSMGVYYFYNHHGADDFTVSLLDERRVPEPESDILLVSADKKLALKDESFIHYESDGKVSVNGLTEREATSDKTVIDDISELIVPKGKRASLTFSDGTVMYVNSDTRVIYPTVFKKKTREILVDGEVFLDVHKDTFRPFTVRTKGFEVKVLGTQFNLNSYQNETESSIVLVSGSIEVEMIHKNKTVLQPNQLMEITDNKVNIKEVDVFEHICWKDNMLSLNDNTAGDILERLSRYYGRTIIYDGNVRNVLSISGKLDIKETAEEAVEVICLSLSLKYTVDEDNNIVVTLN